MGNCLAAPAAVNHAQSKLGHAGKFAAIRDRFETLEEVQQALRKAGLESSEVRLRLLTIDVCHATSEPVACKSAAVPCAVQCCAACFPRPARQSSDAS